MRDEVSVRSASFGADEEDGADLEVGAEVVVLVVDERQRELGPTGLGLDHLEPGRHECLSGFEGHVVHHGRVGAGPHLHGHRDGLAEDVVGSHGDITASFAAKRKRGARFPSTSDRAGQVIR